MKYLDPKADLTFKRIFGEHAKALEIANKLLKAGMPIASISEMTGLTQAEIEGL
jgi:predicted transposase YdaD